MQCSSHTLKSSKVVVYFRLPKRWHQSNVLARIKLSRLTRRSASRLATRNSRRSVSLIGEEASGLGRGRGVGNSPSPTPSSDSAGLPVPPQRGLPKRYPQLTTPSQTLQTRRLNKQVLQNTKGTKRPTKQNYTLVLTHTLTPHLSY
ncbi:hypothetical protein UPYG_G00104420 [Umbra pygmaea]|uniref:Uncharacterized protein n=1 Tax=Umbra pygmaea TaxID=75934 RepID=A0ABD0X1J0_UMBPY